MWTYDAERVVPADAGAVRAAIDLLVTSLWGDRSRLVDDDPSIGRVDAIATTPDGAETDVWLTWRLEPVPAGTRVTLLLDETEYGPDPTVGINEVLDLLVERVGPPSPAPQVDER